MSLSAPIVFEPLFMERVWGGRRLESLPGKRLPQGIRIGESWEIVDRPEAQSVVHDGPWRGWTLHDLWTQHRPAIFGDGLPAGDRFPLLCKILDAQERLSLQVHPPAAVAKELGGEPKSEMWYILDALLESDVYAGVTAGVTHANFEAAMQNGQVAGLVHALPVKPGDAIYIPSGRLHAIGAGNLIVEIQQNSDTTYRVFDWNRVGIDGQPRQLHLAASLASINFDDVEPPLALNHEGLLVDSEYFQVEKWSWEGERAADGQGTFAIYTVVEGKVECGGTVFAVGSFFLLPAEGGKAILQSIDGKAAVLRTTVPH